jgi:hypothetical protein
MLVTFFALVIAVADYFFGPFPLAALSLTAPLSGALLLFVMLIGTSILVVPIQKTARHLSSYVVNCFRFDSRLLIATFIVLAYALMTFVFPIQGKIMTLAWILFLGIAIDATFYVIHRSFIFLDPHAILNLMTHRAPYHWDVYSRLDAIAEIGYKAFVDSNVALSEASLEHFEDVIHDYLEKKGKKEEEPGELNFFLCRFFQHVDPLVHEAITYHYEPIVSKIVILSSKIALHLAAIHPEEVTLPLHYLGDYALNALQEGLPEVGMKGTAALQTVAREILKKDNLSQLNLKEIFFSIIGHLDEIAKATFSQDKSTNILFLEDPFKDLIELFKAEKLKGHPDTSLVQAELVRVLAEYQALENVMLTMPDFTLRAEEDQRK